MNNEQILLINFGGPRNLSEVKPFLIELLCDQEVLQTPLPAFIHKAIFTPIAIRRSKGVSNQYKQIGGGSPLYQETETLANHLSQKLGQNVICFHRYLPETHQNFINTLKNHDSKTHYKLFPLYPQFSYTTTGSAAKWLKDNLPPHIVNKFLWIKSYPEDYNFITTQKLLIENFLKTHGLNEKESILLFSCHGIPLRYADKGDIYPQECLASFNAIIKHFKEALSYLCYQSKFGPGEWLKPYTLNICKNILNLKKDKKQVLFIPLSFTSDHLETLYEIEYEYLPIIRKRGLKAFRVPAMGLEENFVNTIIHLLKNGHYLNHQMLLRNC